MEQRNEHDTNYNAGNNLFALLVDVLRSVSKYFTEDGNFLRNAVYEDAMRMDASLIKVLLSNDALKERFFTDVEGVQVFDKIGFGWVINNREFLPDSYTHYKNKIGLTNNKGEYISTSNDVELVFPYKDCVLEGGQTKEDQKRSEIFYNETLAPDEVDRLLYPKVLTNAKKYTVDGIEEKIVGFEDTDNLVIKGNNLLALSSLLSRYEGKVKLIYIDPPFNTGSDEFNYNDRFNHSSWLVFMKNRFEAAKKLLGKDGIICINIGNEECSYVQILLDELFGRENYINHITMTTNDPSGFKATSSKIFSTSNHLFFYAKNHEHCSLNKLYIKKAYDENYKYFLLNPDEHYTEWKYIAIKQAVCDSLGLTLDRFKKDFSKEQQFELISKFANENKERVFRTAAIGGGALAKRKATIELSKKNKGIVFQHPNEDIDDFYILNGEGIVFWGNLYRYVDGEYVPATALTDVWSDIKWTGIANEGGVKLKNGKKPEKLLRRIISLTTNESDLVLDYHLGSGTTCAVAHKMNRRWIGIEQLDYGNNDSISRFLSVINGEQTGVSKIENWSGGGSFVYCELAKLNQNFVDRIETATDADIVTIWHEMLKTGFISCRVDPKDIDMEDVAFTELSLDDKKRFLMELLDKNQLYVNYCDMEDETFAVSEEDKAFTNSFYGEM